VKKFVFVLLLSIAHWACAYDLPMSCKAVGDWRRIQGSCDAKGLLQGMGSATQDSSGDHPTIMLSGPFRDGLPNGNMTLQFDVEWTSTSAYALAPKDKAVARGVCMLEFADGKVLNSTMSCTSYKTKNTITVKAGAGKIVWAKAANNRGSELTMDLPEVQIDAIFGSNTELFNAFNSSSVPGTFKGKADLFVLSATGNGGLVITVTNMTGDFSSSKVEMSGAFTSQCFPSYQCKLIPFAVVGTSIAVDARAFIRVAPTGSPERYEMVFSRHPDFSGQETTLLYFKNDKVEFDASKTPCERYRYGAELIAKDNRYDILPRCGKITQRDGRSYEGWFKNGRPDPR
jgi:hypothetical protein